MCREVPHSTIIIHVVPCATGKGESQCVLWLRREVDRQLDLEAASRFATDPKPGPQNMFYIGDVQDMVARCASSLVRVPPQLDENLAKTLQGELQRRHAVQCYIILFCSTLILWI